MVKWYNNNFVVVAIIFLFNLGFKLIYIDLPSLWYDEIISVQDNLLDFGHIKHEAEWDKNPPFYHYVLWIWSKLFGISVFSVRSMSAFFSSITAVLIYLFTKRISQTSNATAATVVFTFHPYLFYYAQEARCYSFLTFLIMIDVMLTYSIVKRQKIGTALLLGVVNFLIFYTHYLAGLLLLCQFLYLSFFFYKRIKLLAAIYITPIVLVLVRFTKKQYLVLLFSQEMSRQKSNVPLSSFERLLSAVSDLYVSNLIFILLVVIFAYVIANKYKNISKNPVEPFFIYLFGTPVLSILILYLVGAWTNVFDARYLIFTIPLSIISLTSLFNDVRVCTFIAGVVFVYGCINIKFGETKRMDYKFAAFLTKEIEKKEDVMIVVQTHDVITLFMYYYDRDIFTQKNAKSPEILAKKDIYYINNVEELKNLNLKGKPVLFFQTFQNTMDNERIISYLKEQDLLRFSTSQIEGIRFSYLKSKEIK